MLTQEDAEVRVIQDQKLFKYTIVMQYNFSSHGTGDFFPIFFGSSSRFIQKYSTTS